MRSGKAGSLAGSFLLLAGCFLPPGDTFFENASPRVVDVRPVQPEIRVSAEQACARLAFSAAASDPDLDDTLRFRWYVDDALADEGVLPGGAGVDGALAASRLVAHPRFAVCGPATHGGTHPRGQRHQGPRPHCGGATARRGNHSDRRGCLPVVASGGGARHPVPVSARATRRLRRRAAPNAFGPSSPASGRGPGQTRTPLRRWRPSRPSLEGRPSARAQC
jgi:hypothetical protein